MMKLINGENEFELFEVPYLDFIITQATPYPMICAKLSDAPTINDSGEECHNYLYKAIIIGGKYYGFKLIEK